MSEAKMIEETFDVSDEFAGVEPQAELEAESEVAGEASDASENVSGSADEEIFLQSRVIEALIFSADAPITQQKIQSILTQHFGEGIDATMLLARLQAHYAQRGVELVNVAGGYAFRTAPDMAAVLKGEKRAELRKPPRAATETLAIVAYHQPVTRAEIEAIRGVQVSRGTLDLLMEAGWIKPGRRRETPGRPVTWLTTPEFLSHFGLSSLRDLPGIEELKAAGLLDSKPVLATLPAEPEFKSPHESHENESNDFLPAGDETHDINGDEIMRDMEAEAESDISDEDWEAQLEIEGEEQSSASSDEELN